MPTIVPDSGCTNAVFYIYICVKGKRRLLYCFILAFTIVGELAYTKDALPAIFFLGRFI